MAEPLAPRGEAHAAPTDDAPHGDIDWQAIEASPEFQELVRKRRSFILPATIFFLGWYMGFILLTAYAEGFMSERVYEGLTVGYSLALTQFVMVFVLGLMYLNRSAKVYDPLAAKAIERWEHLDTDAARAGRTEDSSVGSRAATTTNEEPAR
ncbi:MAG: DUF485 domain-containing protein [Actinomycetota bacterium]|nr:DUF485 domain-containing protein [Actinomycetota bacterium]